MLIEVASTTSHEAASVSCHSLVTTKELQGHLHGLVMKAHYKHMSHQLLTCVIEKMSYITFKPINLPKINTNCGDKFAYFFQGCRMIVKDSHAHSGCGSHKSEENASVMILYCEVNGKYGVVEEYSNNT